MKLILNENRVKCQLQSFVIKQKSKDCMLSRERINNKATCVSYVTCNSRIKNLRWRTTKGGLSFDLTAFGAAICRCKNWEAATKFRHHHHQRKWNLSVSSKISVSAKCYCFSQMCHHLLIRRLFTIFTHFNADFKVKQTNRNFFRNSRSDWIHIFQKIIINICKIVKIIFKFILFHFNQLLILQTFCFYKCIDFSFLLAAKKIVLPSH